MDLNNYVKERQKKELSEMAKKMKMSGMKIEGGKLQILPFGKIDNGLYNG